MIKFKLSRTRRKLLKLMGLGGLSYFSVLWQDLTRNTMTASPVGNSSKGGRVAEEAPSSVLSSESFSLPTKTFSFQAVRVNERGEPVESIDGQANYFEEDLGDGVTLDMVLIPGGSFIMGSPNSEEIYFDEIPQHQVTLTAFAMGKYPVTQAQWQAIMGTNPSVIKGDRRPVENVSWHQAVDFCDKLSNQTGREYGLPSEAQWEYACRAGTTTPFHFGETITSQLANFDGLSTYAQEPTGVYRNQTTEVGSFPPNAFGLYNMHGNVKEWCEDVWNNNYSQAPIDGSSWLTGGDAGVRVWRGGSYMSLPWYCRSTYRSSDSAGVSLNDYGFRVMLSLPRQF